MAVHRVGGFSLVEVLVALFVLAVGIAGASATQLASQRSRHGAELAAEGGRLASSLAERMRANPAVMAGADDSNPYLLEYDAAADPAPELANTCFAGADCTPAELAGFDVYETIDALRSRFPRGRIRVCRDAGEALSWDCQPAAGAPLVIKLGWRGNEPAAAQDELAPSVALVVRGAP